MKETKIDFDQFEQRMVILPPPAGNIGGLAAVSGKVAFMRYPNTGSTDNNSSLKIYNLEDREEKTLIDAIGGYEVSADGKKVLVMKDGKPAIVKFEPDQKIDKSLRIEEMEMTVTPQEEWKQIFNDAWRFERDFFMIKTCTALTGKQCMINMLRCCRIASTAPMSTSSSAK